MADHSKAFEELERNVSAYESEESSLVEQHRGHVALYHKGRRIEIFLDEDSAYISGCKAFGLGKFSLMTIGETMEISIGALSLNIGGSQPIT